MEIQEEINCIKVFIDFPPLPWKQNITNFNDLLSVQEAVEMLKLTGKKVRLKICRYTRGLKFEQQQVEIFLKLVFIAEQS